MTKCLFMYTFIFFMWHSYNSLGTVLNEYEMLLDDMCDNDNRTTDIKDSAKYMSNRPSRKMIARREAFYEAIKVGVAVPVLKIIMNHENAGFFAYMTFALNQLLYAEQHNFFPVIFFGRYSGCEHCESNGSCDLCGTNAYFDEEHGNNSWEYFFKQPGLISFSEIEALRQSGANITIHTLPDLLLWNLHLRDPNSVYTHGYGFYEDADPKTFYYDHRWFQSRRLLAHELINDYVRLEPSMAARLRAMLPAAITPRTLGLHIRATDKGIWGGARKVSDCARRRPCAWRVGLARGWRVGLARGWRGASLLEERLVLIGSRFRARPAALHSAKAIIQPAIYPPGADAPSEAAGVDEPSAARPARIVRCRVPDGAGPARTGPAS
jgi:hypothetical protein